MFRDQQTADVRNELKLNYKMWTCIKFNTFINTASLNYPNGTNKSIYTTTFNYQLCRHIQLLRQLAASCLITEEEKHGWTSGICLHIPLNSFLPSRCCASGCNDNLFLRSPTYQNIPTLKINTETITLPTVILKLEIIMSNYPGIWCPAQNRSRAPWNGFLLKLNHVTGAQKQAEIQTLPKSKFWSSWEVLTWH